MTNTLVNVFVLLSFDFACQEIWLKTVENEFHFPVVASAILVLARLYFTKQKWPIFGLKKNAHYQC